MKSIYFLCGSFFIGLTILLLPQKLKEWEVARADHLVQVRIHQFPSDCGITSKAKRWMRIEYRSRIYSKQISHGDCISLEGRQHILMKHLSKYPEIFLFQKDTGVLEVISGAALFTFGLFCIGTGIWAILTKK
ncbi:hypothetical protein [Hymenobacter yonginensis]|uniref:DUF3592 domain-containing protein n=1 Tax=Hymenobacter yonginensis TaxID=748197 RepID=A0ABY7PVI1_9BACT|nr:hypothetical protein [Hymenobacter yonginensis]WBO86539.1 hypothetical protein O9Z63_09810 [Hymenobacter yonginensis]